MTTSTPGNGSPPAGRSAASDGADRTAVAARRVRSTFAVLTGIVAVMALLTSLVALWARSVLFEPGPVAAAVESALAEPEVTEALAVYLTDQVLLAVGADDAVLALLPAQLDQLAPAITGGVRAYVSDRLAAVLADDEVRAVIVELTRRAHTALLRVLDGDGLMDGLTIAEGTVRFNALPLVGRGLVIVQELGLLAGVDVPAMTATGDPDAQRAELAAALDRELPAGFGEIVVYRGEAASQVDATLDAAQRLVLLARRALIAVMVLTVVAAAVSLLLARRRGRAAALLAVASVATMLVVRALGNAVIERVPTLAVQPGARAAVRSIVGTLVSGLITTVTVVAIAGAASALILWLVGASRTRGRLPARVRTEVAVAVVALAAALMVIGAAGLGAGPAVVSLVLAAIGGGALLLHRRRPAVDSAAGSPDG